MRYLLLGLCAFQAVAAVSEAEEQRLLQYLEDSSRGLHAAVRGLTPEQLRFRPAPDRWSVIECAEHIVLVEEQMLEGLRRLLAKPPDPALKAKATDAYVFGYGKDRSKKEKTTAEFVPTGRFGSLEAILKRYDEVRAETARLAGTKRDLRAWVHKEWSFDGYQWLVMMAPHVERHTLQIQEVKASIR